MREVIKGTLTRRLILLFMALSIIPSFAIVTIPLIVRANEQKKIIAEMEINLQKNAEDTFSRTVIAKVSHYQQVLKHHSQNLENILFYITQNESQNWEKATAHYFEQDQKLQYLIIQTKTDGIKCFTQSGLENYCNISLIEEYQFENELKNFESKTFIVENSVKLITHLHNDLYAISAVYDVQKILNEVPRYGLAEKSTLIFIDNEGRFLGYPSTWGDVEVLDQMNVPKDNLIGKTLQSILPIQEKNLFSYENLQIYQQKLKPTVLSSEFVNGKVFFAFQHIENTPISVLLLLPLTDLYEHAIFYGASLSRVEIVPIVIQAVVTLVGFLLVIFFDAAISLRIIADPLKTLHDGATSIAKNQLDVRVPETGLGEIKILATAFNKMAESIQSTQKDLYSKQIELEDSLAARVEELSVITGIISYINVDLDLTKKLNGVVEILCQFLTVVNAKIYLYDRQGKLKLTTDYECQQINENSDCFTQEIAITYRDQRKGKLILSINPDHPFTPIQFNFLETISATIGILIENEDLQNRAKSITISTERRNLARDLHDSVTQTLFSVYLAAEGLNIALKDQQNPVAKRALQLLTDQLNQVRSEMRGLILELSPISLDKQSLVEAIRSHADSLQRSTSMRINIETSGPLDDLPYDLQTALNRIVQESISNIARHARATEVKISLNKIRSKVLLIIEDNGIGFDVKNALKQKGSFGLNNIRERCESFGGITNIKSQIKRGTRISVVIPIEETK